MARLKGTCAFCGRIGKLSKEDGWPRWFNKVLPRPVAPGVAHNVLFEKGEVTRHDRRWVVSHNTEKFPHFCERHCNNGWMSRLEMAVQPVLTPLLFGLPAVLSVADQELIAKWCTKTALVMEFKNPENREIPDDFLREFGEKQKPLDRVHIYIARYAGNDWATNRARMGLDINFNHEPFREHMQLSTFCAWKFVFQAVFLPPTGISREDSRYAIRIHPSDGEPKTWPPELALATDDFYEFASADSGPDVPPMPPRME